MATTLTLSLSLHSFLRDVRRLGLLSVGTCKKKRFRDAAHHDDEEQHLACHCKLVEPRPIRRELLVMMRNSILGMAAAGSGRGASWSSPPSAWNFS